MSQLVLKSRHPERSEGPAFAQPAPEDPYIPLDRRNFLKFLGGGLLIPFDVPEGMPVDDVAMPPEGRA